jgi:hypothetical protein
MTKEYNGFYEYIILTEFYKGFPILKGNLKLEGVACAWCGVRQWWSVHKWRTHCPI